MTDRKIGVFFLGVIGLWQSLFAITIINQTDSSRTIELEEAYRPVPVKPGDLAAPVSLGYKAQKVKVAPHSVEKIPLREPCSVLLMSVINETKKGKKTESIKTCYEPYSLEGEDEQYFNDDWGFVIHKPIQGKSLSLFDPDYYSKKWTMEQAEKQGYGIMCLHPLLLIKITSLEELPEDLKCDIGGESAFSIRLD